jgi:hypothetical protein
MFGVKESDPHYLGTSYTVGCKHCHSQGKLNFFFYYSYFHFGFLNLFPIRKAFYSQCDACKHYLPGTSFDPFYARELDGFKAQAKFPWSLYIFPAIVGFSILEAIVSALF